MQTKTTFLTLIAVLAFISVKAQLISTNPAFPTAAQPVTITFNAADGNKGLMGYTGDVYAHTGVITDKSTTGSDWKYVKTNWGVNTPETKLTRVEGDIYTLEITPSIKDYYGVPDGETILQMAFVFRSSTSDKQGKTATGGDIYADVYDLELSVNLIKPETNRVVALNETIEIEAASILSDSLIVYVDNQRLGATKELTIELTHSATIQGKHWIIAEAKNTSGSVYDSLYYYVRETTCVVDLPAGVKKGVNYIDDSTVTLVLMAPEKEFVFVQGDFNDWDFTQPIATSMVGGKTEQVSSTTWQMNKTPDGEYFWLTIQNQVKGAEYAFQYLVDGTINIADPYTEKILDPWNDPYISSTTYPNLKAYPTGKATQAVSVFQTGQEPYNWQVNMDGFTPPAVTDMVIYEMLVRDFVSTHCYKTIADTLDYLQKLGINVLELMPINEFEGNSSWGYNPSFYFAPDKYYGPKNDLKKLVDECHKRGIAVVIDLVLNHSYGQSPLVRLYFENGKPAANNPWYNVTSNFTNPDAQWGYDFNHESAATQELVDSINSFWMSQYHVDGFRFDFTKGFGNNIKDASDSWGSKYDADRIRLLKRMYDEIKERNPDAYVICEHLADNAEEKELANYGLLLWGNLNNNYCEASMGYTSTSDFSWISYKNRAWDDAHVVGYMESHDEERQMYKNLTWGNGSGGYSVKELTTALHRGELCANFFLTGPGPKMVWQFGELGYDITIDYNGRVGEKPIHWDYYADEARKRLYDVYSALACLRVSEQAFETTDYTISLSGAAKSIHLNGEDMKVVVLGNFDVTEQSINPAFQQTGKWYEFYSGDSIIVDDVSSTFTFAPGEYRLYTTKKLAKPEINSSIWDDPMSQDQLELNIFPNPSNSKIWFDNGDTFSGIAIYNVLGEKVKMASQIKANQGIEIVDLSMGIYFVVAKNTKGQFYSGKFIKE